MRIVNIKGSLCACRTPFPELIPSNGKPEAIGPDSQFLSSRRFANWPADSGVVSANGDLSQELPGAATLVSAMGTNGNQH
jgi:hypothetical protein